MISQHAPPLSNPLAPGQARARVAMVDGDSSVVLQQGRAPSKLLVPIPRGKAAWICHLTFGGGVVAGDRISLDLDLAEGSTALSATQGATKVYRDPEQRWSEQNLSARIDDGALLVHLPHPVTAYAEARYRQHSYYHCAPGGSVLWWDVLTAGRPAQGEHWSFESVSLASEVHNQTGAIARDALRLQGVFSRAQLQAYRCIFSLGLYGPRCQGMAREILALQSASSQSHRWVVSPLGDGGCLLRGLSDGVESARDACRGLLPELPDILGDDPWKRFQQ